MPLIYWEFYQFRRSQIERPGIIIAFDANLHPQGEVLCPSTIQLQEVSHDRKSTFIMATGCISARTGRISAIAT
ncbi:hypothetical protein [Calothrix sp. NIES-3974]|uniref:hypothetical protein n=1 Tax=Calothrix sp. NIES-3974 TaxID=2005462 RepID=UPI0012FE49AA|nr:hypothetical protein [Calothrix sp. NIES-3974]